MAKSTIEIPQELLRTLHRIQERRTELRGRIDRIPRQRKAAETLVSAAQQSVEQAKDDLRKTKMVSDEKQLQLQSREAHVQDLQAKLNTAASNKEFALLKEQIAADEQANSVQSDEILETLEQLDLLAAKLTDCEADLAKQEQECADRIREIDAKGQQLQEDLESVESQLKESESKLPAAALDDYMRLTSVRGDQALAPLEGESCGGCYQTLTTQTISQLQLSILTHCPNCNSLLYLPEDLRVR